MTKYLRTISTQRLLAMIAGLLVAIGAGTAIAVAAAGNGPVPKPKPLAQAIHAALTAPAVNGISARISFSNHLIDATDVQGSDPILTGATGRLWLASDHRLRLELQSDNGDAQIVVNKNAFWVYEPSSNTVYEGTIPAAGAHNIGKQAAGSDRVPTVAQIQSDLNRLVKHLNVSTAIPSDVAGHPTYTVRVSPRHGGGLVGSAELAWDALRGVPLRFAVYARGNPSPVLELKATSISYGRVPTSDFAISPPAGAKVVRIKTTSTEPAANRGRARAHHAQISGTAAVARRLPFSLVSPAKLVGLQRRSVTLLDWGGSPAALVTYGENLGGIAVIEQTATSAKVNPAASQSGDRRGLSLPTVSINGATGQELDTALGTVIRFSRGGVSYTVLGSVPPSAAEIAARAL